MAVTDQAPPQSDDKPIEPVESVVIRFCGDSGDGMQLAGTQFTNVSAAFGNDVSTLPDFPAEIRAPAVRWPASADSSSAFPATTSSRPETKSTHSSP